MYLSAHQIMDFKTFFHCWTVFLTISQLKAKKQKRVVCLNPEIMSTPLPDIDVKELNANIDSLKETTSDQNDPISSCTSSTGLEPQLKERLNNSMDFAFSSKHVYSELYHESVNRAKQFSPVIPDEISVLTTESQLNCTLPHQAHQKCSSSKLSSSTASYFSPQLYAGSAQASILPSEQFIGAQSQAVIKNERDYRALTITHLHPGPSAAVNISNSSIFSSTAQEESNSHKDYLPKFLSTQSIEISRESESCEDLTECGEKFHKMKENGLTSSRSTPIRTSRQLNRRSRIAAQFSMPIN